MAKYIALLRGVNVGGNILKMERLRALCAELGFANVRTYVQSGNLIFDARPAAAKCAESLEKSLIGESRLPVSVIVRTPRELKAVIDANPFPLDNAGKKKNGESSDREIARLYVAFLAASPRKEATKKLSELDFGAEQFHLARKEIYMFLPEGAARSKLSNNLFEKILGVRATTRNWNTIIKLYSLATE